MQLNVKKTNQAPVLAEKWNISWNKGVEMDVGKGGRVTVSGDPSKGSASIVYQTPIGQPPKTCC